MLRTRVGYAGGTTDAPTYRRIGDHTEVFQVDYDPAVISFEELLDVFWDSHEPCRTSWSTQYKAILFYETEAERDAARASAKRIESKRGRPVKTELRELDAFFFAEDYHQKYRLRGSRRLFAGVRALFGSERAFSESTAAARINAYLDGHLDYEALGTELEKIGLRAVGEKGLERVEVLPKRVQAAPESRPTSRPTSPAPR